MPDDRELIDALAHPTELREYKPRQATETWQEFLKRSAPDTLAGVLMALQAMPAPGIRAPLSLAPSLPPPMRVFRAGGEQGMGAAQGGPTFYSTTEKGAAPYAAHGDYSVKSYGLAPAEIFDTQIGPHRALYEEFLKDTQHPGRYGSSARPFWTTESDLRQWLANRGHNYKAMMFDENTGAPSVAVYDQSLVSPWKD